MFTSFREIFKKQNIILAISVIVVFLAINIFTYRETVSGNWSYGGELSACNEIFGDIHFLRPVAILIYGYLRSFNILVLVLPFILYYLFKSNKELFYIFIITIIIHLPFAIPEARYGGYQMTAYPIISIASAYFLTRKIRSAKLIITVILIFSLLNVYIVYTERKPADSMFGRLVALLEHKGAFENALVIVLSDHGEALGLPNDSFRQEGTVIEGLGAPLKMMDAGHGQSVLSPTQYRVLLGFRAFGDEPILATSGADIPRLATVEDIAPTVLDLLGIEGDPLSTTGMSLADDLRSVGGSTSSSSEPARIRFTETDLAVLPSPGGGVDEMDGESELAILHHQSANGSSAHSS